MAQPSRGGLCCSGIAPCSGSRQRTSCRSGLRAFSSRTLAGLTFKRTLRPQVRHLASRGDASSFRLTVARRRRISRCDSEQNRNQRTVFPSTKSAVNVICGKAPQGRGEREKQQVIKSRTKSSRGAARGRASPLSGEPGTRVRAIRADRWRPEGQRASNGRPASRGSDRRTRRRDSIHG